MEGVYFPTTVTTALYLFHPALCPEAEHTSLKLDWFLRHSEPVSIGLSIDGNILFRIIVFIYYQFL